MPLHFAAAVRLSVLLSAAVASATLFAQQNAFSPGGDDYPISGVLPGEQTGPHAAISVVGGFLVWQDNAAGGSGLGISAVRLGADLHRVGEVFRVNSNTVGDHEKPQVALLQNNGAIVVWQGGNLGSQKIYARILAANGTPAGGDVLVNTYTYQQQMNPAVAVLADGNIVVVWSSAGQDGSLQGVYAQRLNPTGQKLGGEFRVNFATANNQRSPAVAALSDGRFVVAWVSELQRGVSDVYARIYDAAGNAVTGELAVNSDATRPCSAPSITGSADGKFTVAWCQHADALLSAAASGFDPDTGTPRNATGRSGNGWEVFARLFDSSGGALGGSVMANTHRHGDQFNPKISLLGKDCLVVWNSIGQDGQAEGVFGQFLTPSGAVQGVEFKINTSTISRQIHPALTSDRSGRFLVLWSTYVRGSGFDLMAREFELIRAQMEAVAGGVRLTWNTKAGCSYQVQASADINGGNWSDIGAPRPASGTSDSFTVVSSSGAAYYRVIRVQ